MRIIGIDPGLSGGIAVLDDLKIFDIFDMPIMSEGKKNKNQLNSAQLVNIIKKHIISKWKYFFNSRASGCYARSRSYKHV